MSASREAIERLYVVFADYRAGRVSGCAYCVSREEQLALHGARLRELSGRALGPFAAGSLGTWGTMKDFKHFLPRILELYAKDAIWTADLQAIYSKSRQEDHWPDVEIQALVEYTKAILHEVVLGRSGWNATTILESAGLIGSDVRALAADAFSPRPLDEKRASTLADLVRVREKALSSDDPGWLWWKDAQAGQLEEWLLSGAAHEALTSAFEAMPDHPDAGAWASAADVLEALGGCGSSP